MSKIVQAIRATPTGRDVPLRERVSIQVASSFTRTYPYASVYEIALRVGGTANITNQMQGRALEAAVNAVQRAVIEEVFGEFRPLFREIEMAFWNDNPEEAKRLLHRMEQQMFTTEGSEE